MSSSFSFNFFSEDEETKVNNTKKSDNEEKLDEEENDEKIIDEEKGVSFHQHFLTQDHQTTSFEYHEIVLEDLVFQVPGMSDDNDGGEMVKEGIWEGGDVVWECSLNLISYLQSTISSSINEDHDLNGREVMEDYSQVTSAIELGCGGGLESDDLIFVIIDE